MELDCDCDGWQRSMPDIRGAMVLGRRFTFCPWCGDPLLSAETREYYRALAATAADPAQRDKP